MALTPHSGNVCPKLCEQVLQTGKAYRVLVIAHMFMVTLTRFIVVAQDADAGNDINKAVFVVVLAGGYVWINPPNLDANKGIFPGKVEFLIHHHFGWHLLLLLDDGNHNINIILMSIKPSKALDRLNCWRYAYPAPYKTGAGRCNPKLTKAISDAESVFFVVRYTRYSMAWYAIQQQSYNRRSTALLSYHAANNGAVCPPYAGVVTHSGRFNSTPRRQRMVTLAGQPQGWPVSFVPGIATPVNVTALFERCNSGGGSLTRTKEAA
ncbi:ash family protein [Salmonella enterica subsp. enterica serovar Newport]